MQGQRERLLGPVLEMRGTVEKKGEKVPRSLVVIVGVVPFGIIILATVALYPGNGDVI